MGYFMISIFALLLMSGSGIYAILLAIDLYTLPKNRRDALDDLMMCLYGLTGITLFVLALYLSNVI